jgi:hypothetical protein
LPTTDELKLIKFLGLSERTDIWVEIVDSLYYEVANARTSKKVQIPCSGLAFRRNFSPKVRTLGNESRAIFFYPNAGFSENVRRTFARNLQIILLEVDVLSRIIDEQKLVARKTEKEKRLRARIEFGGEFDDSNERSD